MEEMHNVKLAAISFYQTVNQYFNRKERVITVMPHLVNQQYFLLIKSVICIRYDAFKMYADSQLKYTLTV